jgi:hypothetical protein
MDIFARDPLLKRDEQLWSKIFSFQQKVLSLTAGDYKPYNLDGEY